MSVMGINNLACRDAIKNKNHSPTEKSAIAIRSILGKG